MRLLSQISMSRDSGRNPKADCLGTRPARAKFQAFSTARHSQTLQLLLLEDQWATGKASPSKIADQYLPDVLEHTSKANELQDYHSSGGCAKSRRGEEKFVDILLSIDCWEVDLCKVQAELLLLKLGFDNIGEIQEPFPQATRIEADIKLRNW